MQYKTIKSGDIIVSSPYMNKGLVFNKSVILIMSHDKNGTSGVIINKLLNNLNGDEIIKSLQIPSTDKTIVSPKAPANPTINLAVYFGGPVEQEKGIILHSNNYQTTSSMRVTKEISVSTSAQIINDIVSGTGPLQKMLILGYASWKAGQLMAEIKNNDWLLLLDKQNKAENIDAFELIFLEDPLYRWPYALKLAGVNINNYSNSIGNA